MEVNTTQNTALARVGKTWEDTSNENPICSAPFVHETEEVIKVRWSTTSSSKPTGPDAGI